MQELEPQVGLQAFSPGAGGMFVLKWPLDLRKMLTTLLELQIPM